MLLYFQFQISMWFVHSFIHLTSIFECLLGPGTILGTWDVAICKTDDIDGGVGDDDDEKRISGPFGCGNRHFLSAGPYLEHSV